MLLPIMRMKLKTGSRYPKGKMNGLQARVGAFDLRWREMVKRTILSQVTNFRRNVYERR